MEELKRPAWLKTLDQLVIPNKNGKYSEGDIISSSDALQTLVKENPFNHEAYAKNLYEKASLPDFFGGASAISSIATALYVGLNGYAPFPGFLFPGALAGLTLICFNFARNQRIDATLMADENHRQELHPNLVFQGEFLGQEDGETVDKTGYTNEVTVQQSKMLDKILAVDYSTDLLRLIDKEYNSTLFLNGVNLLENVEVSPQIEFYEHVPEDELEEAGDDLEKLKVLVEEHGGDVSYDLQVGAQFGSASLILEWENIKEENLKQYEKDLKKDSSLHILGSMNSFSNPFVPLFDVSVYGEAMTYSN